MPRIVVGAGARTLRSLCRRTLRTTLAILLTSTFSYSKTFYASVRACPGGDVPSSSLDTIFGPPVIRLYLPAHTMLQTYL